MPHHKKIDAERYVEHIKPKHSVRTQLFNTVVRTHYLRNQPQTCQLRAIDGANQSIVDHIICMQARSESGT